MHLRSGIIPTMDVWAGAAGAAIYGIATLSHPDYKDINTFLVGKPKAFMTPLGARSVVVLFLTSMYIVRVASMHYIPAGKGPGRTLNGPAGAAVPSKKVTVKPVSQQKKVQ